MESSFVSTATELRSYKDVPALYAKHDLPQKKAIKRIFFKNPALIFYAKEVEALPFKNYDVGLSGSQSHSSVSRSLL